MADQEDFPSIYIDGSSAGDGSLASPYSNLSDINWTTGGDNSIFDYLAGTPTESPTIYLAKGAEWRGEQLLTLCDGTATYPIVITAYGSGDDPIVNGSNLITTWTETATTENAGDSTSGASANWISGDYIYWFKVTVSNTGTVSNSYIYVGATTNDANVKMAIYSDDGGNSPGTPITNGTSDAVAISPNSWNEFTYSTPASVSAGTYWLAVWGDNTFNNTKAGSASNSSAYKSIGYGAGWPSPAAEDSMAVWTDMDMYMVVDYDLSNVWEAACTTEPAVVFLDGTRGTVESSTANLDAANEWYWAGNKLYVYSTSDPDTAFTDPGIEAGAIDYGIYANGNDYITVDGLNVIKCNIAGIRADTAATNFTVQNCTAAYNYSLGINVSTNGSDNALIDNNTIYSNGGCGISVSNNSDGTTITNNISHHNAIDNNISTTAGIYCISTGHTNITIEGNTVYSNGFKAGSEETECTEAGQGSGIWLDTVGSGAVIRYNLSYNNRRIGIHIEKNNGTECYYNITYGQKNTTTSKGIWLNCDDGDHPNTNNKVYNNVSYDNAYGISLSGLFPQSGNTCSNNIVKNNIFYGNTNGDSKEFSAFMGAENDGTYGSGNVYTYNCLGAEYSNFIEWGNGVYKSTYDTWETAYGGPTYSAEDDPAFVDPSNGDFTLQVTSPCLNTGVDVSLTTDYAGNAVTDPPNMGAYETVYSLSGGGLHLYMGLEMS